MKIDIHIHTKAIKSGDAATREIDAQRFCNIIRSTDVKICAITNHNHFDLGQYNQIASRANDDFQVWPGVELDVVATGRRGHLLILVNPKNSSVFANRVDNLVGATAPDTFSVGIEVVASVFDDLDAIFVPHYNNKKPNISDEGIEVLSGTVMNGRRILKEASNSISAGIFIGHGHKTIYGSDIQDWDDYVALAAELPDLRLPVESYEQFCLLLERDDSTIESIRSKKSHQVIPIKPFREDPPFQIDIWDDINVLFGSKGTGKTDILHALSKYYNENGHKTSVFESNLVNLAKHYDLAGNSYQLNMADLPVVSCQTEFETVRKATERNVTSMKKYFEYYSVSETSKISNRMKVKNLATVDGQISKIRFRDIGELMEQLDSFTSVLASKDLYKEIIGEELFSELLSVISRARVKIAQGFEVEFTTTQVAHLFNHLIGVIVSEIARKTGQPEKPITTGFSDYASNRIEIELALEKILRNIDTPIAPKAEFVGDLGSKGKLFCKTILKIQNGEVVDSDFKHLKSTTKNPEKYVARTLREIQKSVYTSSLFEKIADLNMIESGDTVLSIENLILFKRIFELEHREYRPSNGESAMILLAQELASDKEIFIIDEPEKSLGNDYISDFIVPLLKGLAYSGKRIIIATHDANIAVRTLPYNSIYREHEFDRYRTYFGNPFSNRLVCKENSTTHDWKEISMRTLEGGRDAFGERGKIYGNA